ncbi:MAG: DUF4145 domain-containing protein [Nitrospirota bacterium]
MKHEQKREDNFWGYPQLLEAEILRCCGCDLLSFRLVKHPFAFQDKKDKPVEDIFPERGFKKREQKYFFQLPKEVHNLYQETVVAHDRELSLLSTVGLRALIEAIVADKLSEDEYGPNLETKINALSKYFQKATINTLHEFRIMGNKAIHSQVAPDCLDIHRALFVVESIMEFFYGIDEYVDNFQKYKEVEKKKRKSPKTYKASRCHE